MEIVEWYLEQATAAIEGPLEKRRVREELREHLDEHAQVLMGEGMPKTAAYREAVWAMGDVKELAEQLGEIHCYDTQAGFSRMIGVLWIGILLISLHVGTDKMWGIEKYAGNALVLFSMFRLRKISPYFASGYKVWFGCTVAEFPVLTCSVLPDGAAVHVACGAFRMIQIVCYVCYIYFLSSGVQFLLPEEQSGKIILLRWIGVINAAIGFIGMVRSGFEEIKVTISLPPVFLPIILFLFIAGIWCLVQIWKIKRALQSETEIGIEPFRGRDFLVPALAWLAVVLLPAVMSAVVSTL